MVKIKYTSNLCTKPEDYFKKECRALKKNVRFKPKGHYKRQGPFIGKMPSGEKWYFLTKEDYYMYIRSLGFERV